MNKLDKIREILSKKAFIPNYSSKHFQTIYGVMKKRDKSGLPIRHVNYLRLKDKDKIKLDCYWQKNKKKPVLVVIHGMVGSSRTEYVLGISSKAFKRGYNIVAVNLRNCGGTEKLSRKLYHAGQSDDIKEVIKWLVKHGFKKIGVICFSLSGNIVLKMAGEWGKRYPKEVFGVAAVSPLVDLEASWRHIDKRENRLYRIKFLRGLKNLILQKAKYFPEYDVSLLKYVKTVRDFDHIFHTRYSGFKSADDYYKEVSARPLLKKISVPCLILHADDDSIVPLAPLREKGVVNDKKIILLLTKHGGHAGFISKKKNNEDIFWAENRVLEFFDLLLS